MRYFIVAIVLIFALLGLLPDPPHEPEPGTIEDAYYTWLANRKAYADQPCIRLSNYTPRFRPQGHVPNFKPADWQKCTRTP